jgi:hypothetical protein
MAEVEEVDDLPSVQAAAVSAALGVWGWVVRVTVLPVTAAATTVRDRPGPDLAKRIGTPPLIDTTEPARPGRF